MTEETKETDKWLVPYDIEPVGGNKLTVTVGTVQRMINEHATYSECVLFLRKCQQYGADPLMGDMHLIKYSKDQKDPPAIVAGVGFFEKKAQLNKKFKGYGLTYWMNSKGEWKDVHLDKTPPLACKKSAFVDGYVNEQWKTTHWDEAKGLKKDGSLKAIWLKMPATMIEKVCKVRLLRELFSADFGGLYSEDEDLQSPDMNIPLANKNFNIDDIKDVDENSEPITDVDFKEHAEQDLEKIKQEQEEQEHLVKEKDEADQKRAEELQAEMDELPF